MSIYNFLAFIIPLVGIVVGLIVLHYVAPVTPKRSQHERERDRLRSDTERV